MREGQTQQESSQESTAHSRMESPLSEMEKNAYGLGLWDRNRSAGSFP